MSLAKLSLGSVLLLAGCISSTPKQQPLMTAAEHESRARKAEQVAQEHEKRRDPGAYNIQRCGAPPSTPVVLPPPGVPGGVNGPSVSTSFSPCSPSAINLDRDHETEATRQRWIAAKHRNEAAKIRAREAKACQGLSDDERTADLLVPQQELVAVRELPDYSRTGKASDIRGGASLLLRSETGQNARQVEQRLQCRVARAAVNSRSELESSPLAVPGAEANVIETDDGWLVEVTANNRKTVQEIKRRAKALEAKP